MGSYVLKRVFHSVLLAFAVSILTFALLELAPGSYFDELKANPNVSTETIRLLKTRYGLDKPLPMRYVLSTPSARARGEDSQRMLVAGFSVVEVSPTKSLLADFLQARASSH